MKRTTTILATLLILGTNASSVWAQSAHAQHQSTISDAEQVIQSQGVVKSIDLENKKVTIAHEPIAILNWPAMTMRFTAQDENLIRHLKTNDNVRFRFIQQGHLSILQSIDIID